MHSLVRISLSFLLSPVSRPSAAIPVCLMARTHSPPTAAQHLKFPGMAIETHRRRRRTSLLRRLLDHTRLQTVTTTPGLCHYRYGTLLPANTQPRKSVLDGACRLPRYAWSCCRTPRSPGSELGSRHGERCKQTPWLPCRVASLRCRSRNLMAYRQPRLWYWKSNQRL
jgi:hypothetical protein